MLQSINQIPVDYPLVYAFRIRGEINAEEMRAMGAIMNDASDVDKYAVVGAPSVAATMINVMDNVIPTDARTFLRSEEVAAWAFVGASPVRRPTAQSKLFG